MDNSKHYDIDSLLKKLVWQMTGEEFCQLSIYASSGNPTDGTITETKRAIGIHDLATAIGCCDSTVYALKKQGVLDQAIISQIGKKIVFDVEKARTLAEAFQREQREARRESRRRNDGQLSC